MTRPSPQINIPNASDRPIDFEPLAVGSSDVAVVICTYTMERWPDLLKCVSALRAQTAPPTQVIVCVDRNDDLLARARAEWSDVAVVGNRMHPGAGGARNSGVEIADAGLVAFIDDDVVPSSTWLERALPHFSDVRVLGLGGDIVPAWEHGRPGWFPSEFDWVLGCTYEGMPRKVATVRNLIAANMIVRRSVFIEMGGFRSGFGKQHNWGEPEETEFCIRTSAAFRTHRWLFVPDAGVTHRVPASRSRFRYFAMRCFNEGVGKAKMGCYVDRNAALATERRYASRVLPRAFLAGIVDAVETRRLMPLARSGAIGLGLGLAVIGYAGGRLASGVQRR